MKNQILERIPIHHPIAMVKHGSMGGMGYPLINVADRFVLQGGQGI